MNIKKRLLESMKNSTVPGGKLKLINYAFNYFFLQHYAILLLEKKK